MYHITVESKKGLHGSVCWLDVMDVSKPYKILYYTESIFYVLIGTATNELFIQSRKNELLFVNTRNIVLSYYHQTRDSSSISSQVLTKAHKSNRAPEYKSQCYFTFCENSYRCECK